MRILFSQKQLQILLKHLIINDENELGEIERDSLLKAWDENNPAKFLNGLEGLTDPNIWKVTRIDVAHWYLVFNMLDQLMEKQVERLSTLSLDQEASKILLIQSVIDQEVRLILRFLRVTMPYASNILYYNSTDRLLALLTYYQNRNLQMVDEVLGILITLSAKQNEKKTPISGKHGLESFEGQVKPYMNYMMDNMRLFDTISDIMINENTATKSDIRIPAEIMLEEYENNQEVATRLSVEMRKFEALENITQREEFLIVILRSINFYLNIGDVYLDKDKFSQTNRLEQFLPPKSFISKLVSLLKATHLSKKLHTTVISLSLLFIILDLNSIFDFQIPTENKYYVEACNHHEYYIATLKSLSRYHGYDKLLTIMTNDISYSELLENQKTLLVDEDSQDSITTTAASETIMSQKFFNHFMNFMCNLLNIKNRALQNLLYPQFMKPLLAIVYVKPVNNQYPININCQLKAAKLLKDVVKMSSLDDPGAVEKMIERLKDEIRMLHDDQQYEKFEDDDNENGILLIYRQDLIRTLLRFLSYSIIRNDPNAINFTQNFVANSRKILDSQLIQMDIIDHIFKPNMYMDKDRVKKTIDPILLQCIQTFQPTTIGIQLVSYLFNDLPQKIPLFIENGLFQQILDSLSERIPNQPDLIILFMKFIQTLCLNPQGAELVASSKVLYSFASLVTDNKTYKQFVNQNKAMNFKDLIQQVSMQNKAVASTLYQAIMKNYDVLTNRAWLVTQQYIEMEEEVLKNHLLTKDQQFDIRFKYEREQVALEQSFESAAYLLWYFAIDEQVNRNDNLIHEVLMDNKDLLDVFMKVITTPIVASACPAMFAVFIEILLQLLYTYGIETKADFILKVLSNIGIQLGNFAKLTQGIFLDDIYDLEATLVHQSQLDLAELNEDPQRVELLARLKAEDQASVIFGKIALYTEIIYKCQVQTRTLLMNNKNFMTIVGTMFKLQALINRYHAWKYERDINRDKKRLEELLQSQRKVIEDTDFTKYQLYKEPMNEEEEVKNLYFKYEYERLETLVDFKTRENSKTVIELTLDENISHTSNQCQIATRKLLNNFLKLVNKRKTHFQDKVDEVAYEFNKAVGKLIAEEFQEFRRLPEPEEAREVQVMKFCCQFSAVFQEFNKILFGGFSHGALMLSFIQNGGIDCVKDLILWQVKYLYILEKSPNKKSLNLCRNIQLLWSHLIDFFAQLIDGKYFDQQQFFHFLVVFKSKPLKTLKQDTDEYKSEYELAVTNMKKYYMSIMAESVHFLFVELNQCKWIRDFKEGQQISVFKYFGMISELFFVSFVDVFHFLSRGFSNVKFFSQPLTQFGPTLKPTIQEARYQDNIKKLVEDMGFREDAAKMALEQARGNLEAATEILLSMPYDMPIPPAPKVEKIEEAPVVETSNEHEDYEEKIDYGKYNKYDVYEILCLTLKDFIRFKPLSNRSIKKNEIIDNVFFKIGADTNDPKVNEVLVRVKQELLELISEALINQSTSMLGTLSYALTALMSYRRGSLLTTKEIYQAIFEIITLFQNSVTLLRDQVSDNNYQSTNDKPLVELIRNIDQAIQMFMHITEEGKISSDLNKLENIMNFSSSLAEQVEEIQTQLDELHMRNKQNMFYQDKEQTGELFQKITMCIIDMFKAMHMMSPQAEATQDWYVHEIVLRGLETLNFLMNIKGYTSFECQSFFLNNEGLRALFGIRSLCSYTQDWHMQIFERRRFNDIQLQSKILLQMLCQNEQTQVKIYENLIKSVLFIQFQERYKKEEGKDLKEEFNVEDIKHQLITQSRQSLPSQSKKKSQTPNKKPKQSEEQKEEKANSTQQKIQSKNVRNQLFRKSEYGEVPLEDFIQFFNSVMQVQDFKSFLEACHNVCIIKRKKPVTKIEMKHEEVKQATIKKDDDTIPQPTSDEPVAGTANQSKRKSKRLQAKKGPYQEPPKEEEPERTYICLNHSSMKDMFSQYESNLQNNIGNQLGTQSCLDLDKHLQHKPPIQNFQQEIIYSLLDQFIEQIRDQQMLILQSCKQKSNPSPMGISMTINDKGQLVIKDLNDKLQYQQHMFDSISILSHLTYVITHTPILVRSLLKHKEGKTYKFIIRNLFFLQTLTVENKKAKGVEKAEQEFTLWCDNRAVNLGKRKIESITEFFKRVMFDNPHLTPAEKRAKQEARQIFQKETLKNLCDQSIGNRYPNWPQLKLIFNLGALWLISIVLKGEDKEDIQDQKKIDQIVLNMQMYRNTFRYGIIKGLIHDCQQVIKQEGQQFQLLKVLEKLQVEIQENMPFFEFNREPILVCIQALGNILKPFENNKLLWGDKENRHGSVLGESSLGFVPNQDDQQSSSIIDEDMNEDEEEDDEDGDESSDSQSEEDDDLLDSEVSERNFRFSQHEPIEDEDDEYGDEESSSHSEDEGTDGALGHHHHGEGDESMSQEDSYGGEAHPDEIQMLENMLGGNEIELVGFGNDNDEAHDDEDEDYYEDFEQQDQEAPAVQGDNNQEPNEEQKQVEGEEQKEEPSEGEYDSEEEPSDEYYDEEIDEDDEQEIEIFIGRDPNNMDRISLQEFGAAGQRPNMQRRDDIMSMNNMSVDFFNMHHHHHRGHDAIQEASDSEAMSQHDHHEGSHDHRAPQIIQRGHHPNNQLGDVYDEILGMINGSRRAQTQSKKAEQLGEDEIAYKPFLTLFDILTLSKVMQQREHLYRSYIKEASDNLQHNIGSNNQKLPEARQETGQVQTSDQEVISTKSQFSTKNPFSSVSQPQRSIFGQYNPSTNAPNNQVTQINTRSTAQALAQELDIDPEFMENLDQSGLQNIADTENLMRQLSHPRQDSVNLGSITQLLSTTTNLEARQQILRNMPEEQFGQLPSALYSEGLQYRQAQRQNQHHAPVNPVIPALQVLSDQVSSRQPARGGQHSDQHMRRSRLMSIDSQLNDMTDFSRQPNDPYFRNQNRGNRFLINIVQDFQTKNNTIYNNFSLYLHDQILDMTNSPTYDFKGNDLDKACEQIIQQSLLAQPDNIEQSFQKVSGFVDMIVTWVKLLTNGAFILQKEVGIMKLLFKIPQIRLGLLVKVYNWFAYGVGELKKYNQEIDSKSEVGSKKIKGFGIDRGINMNGKFDILHFVLHCLRCFKQFVQDSNKLANTAGLDIAKIPTDDTLLRSIIQLTSLQDQSTFVNMNEPIIDQIVHQLTIFYNIVKDKLYLINQETESQEDHWMEDIISNLATIFKQLSTAFRHSQESQDIPADKSLTPPISLNSNMILELGQLLLTKEFKSKQIQKDIKSIFNDIAALGGEGQINLEHFFKKSLEQALRSFVARIQEKKIDIDKLKQEVIVITQILKIARNSNKQESNICDEQLFYWVVKEISALIDRTQQQSTHTTLHQAAFMFKEEFRTVMITLFILFEYNLKFIFTEQADEVFPSKRRSQMRRSAGTQQQQPPASQSQIEVIMQDIQDIKQEMSASVPPSKEKSSLMDAIDQHLALKIKDHHARKDKRLKIFIKFCLEHKKVINSFIRANQQVLNESLRNVIMKVPQLLDFDNKRLLFRSQVKKMQKKYRLKYIDIQVRRDKVFDDSYEQLKVVSADRWKGQLSVEFQDEQGIDEGGLSREWFILLSQEIFNPDLALFLQSNAGSTYYPNPKSSIQPDYVSLFKFVGRIVGKALFEQQLLDCYFVKALYKIILGLPLNYHDVEDFDNELYKNLKWCLENSVEDLGMTFTETRDYFGVNEEIELIEGGKDIEVNNENKIDYVQKVSYQKLYKNISKQLDAFLLGFYDIVPKALIQLFDNRELELLISGLPNIDIMDLRENTIYQNYTSETPVVKWLFEVLEEFENSERAEFIQFVTGSSKVPVEGFKGLRGSRGFQKFQIVKFFTNDTNRLPQAHTCFKQLELPEYSSKQQLKERLLTAIKEGKTFGFA